MSILNPNTSYFTLYNVENYNPTLVEPANVVIEKYVTMLCEYFKFLNDCDDINIDNRTRFVIIRGLQTITHVFNFIMYYCKNIDLAFFHCQKAYYFYIEFVGQITDDRNTFLQLGSRDATLFVYKKTIFDINQEYKTNMPKTMDPSQIQKYAKIQNSIKLIELATTTFINNVELTKEPLNILSLCEMIFIVMKTIKDKDITLENINDCSLDLEAIEYKSIPQYMNNIIDIMKKI